jgi:hypothetical protein
LPDVPELTLVLTGQRPPGLVILRGELAVGFATLGVALPVNPGLQVITTQVPGGQVREHKVTLGKGEKKTVELTVAAAAVSTGAPLSPPPHPDRRPRHRQPAGPSAPLLSWRRAWGSSE